MYLESISTSFANPILSVDILSSDNLLAGLAAAGKDTSPSLFGSEPEALSYELANREGVEGENADDEEPLAA